MCRNDAYVISKLAGLAATRSNLVNGDKTKPYEALCKLINEVQSIVGYDEELVAFVDSLYVRRSAELTKFRA
ncbi:MAG: hypothetical protein ACLR56_14985 [Oscillospiraceae bacterium]